MKKACKLIAILALIVLVFSDSKLITIADSQVTLLKTEGFTVNDQMLKALSNSGTTYLGSPLDKNDDGTLSLNEINDIHSLTLDCTGCSIKDWSDLSLFEYTQELYIENADCSKLELSDSINKEIKIFNLYFDKCTNFNSIAGKDFFGASMVSVNSNESISCKAFTSSKSVRNLKIVAPDITDINELTNMDLSSLTLNSATLKDLDALPKLDNLQCIDISDNALSDLSLLENLNNLTVVYARNNNINNIDILDKYSKLERLELENNNITNIDVLLNKPNLNWVKLRYNPLSEDATNKLFKFVLKCDDPIKGYVDSSFKLMDDKNTYVDIANYAYLSWESLDNSIVEVNDKALLFKKVGTTDLKFTYDKTTEFTYKVVVENSPTPSPQPTDSFDDDNSSEAPTLVPTITPSIAPTEKAYAIGDVNKDGYIDASDALEVLKHAAKLSNIEDTYLADVTEKGTIDAADALQILKLAAKLIKTFE